jgi:hypothetical protein
MKTALRIALLLKLVLLPGLLSAHPMGNFSINHHSTIHVSSGVISVTTVLDFAEIATFQMFPDPRTDENYANRIGWKEVVFAADHPLKFPDGNPYDRDRSIP